MGGLVCGQARTIVPDTEHEFVIRRRRREDHRPFIGPRVAQCVADEILE
jgi:hypothetical protein